MRHLEFGLKVLSPVTCRTLFASQFRTTSSFQSPFVHKKHTRTPFIIFSGEKIAELRKANPGIRVPDLSRMLGQMWRLLTNEQKEIYQLRYKDEKEIFEAKKKAELDGLTETEKSKLLEEEKFKNVKKNCKKRKKAYERTAEAQSDRCESICALL